MKTAKSCVLALALCLLAARGFAADVDGKWTGTVNTPMGEAPVAFEFKADGAALTGTALGLDGSQVDIKNGKIDGSNISFTVTFDFGGMTFEFSYRGVVAPPEIKMNAEFMGMPIDFVLKKS
jgi:hypothetical protein